MSDIVPKMDAFRRPGGFVLVASKTGFENWLRTATPGERFHYARGLCLPGAVGAIPMVRQAYDDGRVLLFQRRLPEPPVGPGGFAYIAVRRQRVLRPAARFVARAR